MKDFYGVEYEESRWTRFVFFWELFGFEKRRSDAFVAWANKTVKRLQDVPLTVAYALNVSAKMDAPISDMDVWLPGVLEDFKVSVTWIHYDSWTKRGADPARRIMEWVAGEKWIRDHPRKAA